MIFVSRRDGDQPARDCAQAQTEAAGHQREGAEDAADQMRWQQPGGGGVGRGAADQGVWEVLPGRVLVGRLSYSCVSYKKGLCIVQFNLI